MEKNPKKARVTCTKEYKEQQLAKRDNSSSVPVAPNCDLEVWEVSDGETEADPLRDMELGRVACWPFLYINQPTNQPTNQQHLFVSMQVSQSMMVEMQAHAPVHIVAH